MTVEIRTGAGTPASNGAGSVIRVLLVDDHPAVRDGLRIALNVDAGIDIVGEASTAGEAVVAARDLLPAVVILDLSLPDARGAAAVRLLAGVVPQAQILVLSGGGESQVVRDCLASGARGYLLKTTAAGDVCIAVRRVAQGERVIDRHLLDVLLQPGESAPLTARELAVLDAISRGLTNRQAAALLGLAESTVKTHIARSMAKLGVADRTEAVASLLRRGLLS